MANEIWIALDDPRSALLTARCLWERTRRFKIGAAIMSHPRGLSIVKKLRDRGAIIMLDWNIKTTPVVAGKTAVNLASHWHLPRFITVAASGGKEMGRAAVQSVRALNNGVEIIANTLLGSMDEDAMGKMWEAPNVFGAAVQARAVMAQEVGCSGVIVAPSEVERVRQALGRSMIILATGIRVPGIRIQGDDLKRTGAAKEALDKGANGLIIGRAATEAHNPLEALDQILNADPADPGTPSAFVIPRR